MNHNHSTPFCHRYHQMLENIIDANSITVRQLEKQYPKIANVLEKHLQTTLQKENIDYIKPLPLPHELPREEPYIKKTHRLRIAAKSGITGHLYLWQDEADHVIRTYEDSQDHPQ